MGDHGYNAGGFAYMEMVTCLNCGRRFKLGWRARRAGDLYCGNRETCENRRLRKEKARKTDAD